MIKIIISLLVVVVTMLPIQTKAASLNDAVKECAAIKRDLKRLACFDLLSGNVTDFEVEEMSPQQRQARRTTINQQQQTTIAEQTVSTPENDFGLTAKGNTDHIDSIRSTIPGEFRGLRKGDEFTLANGQIWKVIGSNTLYHRATNPSVVISKGVFGSFRMKVAGLNKALQVKRIQ